MLTDLTQREVRTIHQVQLWENMLKYFGLKEDLDFNPIELKNVRIKGKIGIFTWFSKSAIQTMGLLIIGRS